MLKRILLLLLSSCMLLSACITGPGETSVNANTEGTQSEDSVTETETADVPKETEQPTEPPKPQGTPFPDELVDESTDYAFVNDDCTLYYLPDESSDALLELEADADLYITGEYEDWFRVSALDNEGFVKKDSVARAHGIIIADEVNLRKGPSLDDDIITKTAINTTVTILEDRGEWLEIRLDDENATTGYMHYEYIDYPEGYITKNGVNVRSIPSTDGDIVGKLDRGKMISVLFSYDGWYSISTDDFSGFVSAEFIQEAPIVASVERQRAYVTESGVNFRMGPATGFDVISRLYKFSPVYIIGETDDWYRVEREGDDGTVTGYVTKEFVEIGKPTVYVTGQDVNLRAKPDGDILTKVRQNSEFVIIGQSDNWLKGEVNKNVGYIRVDYLDDEPVGDGKVKIEFTDDEVYLAAKVVYLEAKGTGYSGYAAVANCLYNRVKSRKFPNNIRDVVFQKNQYTVTKHSNFSSISPSSEALKATRDVLNGGVRPMPLNVLFFFAKRLGTSWGSDKEFYKIVGNNAFFRYVG